jgi:hypothetical protein
MINHMIQLPEKNWSPMTGLQIAACSTSTRAHRSANPFGVTGAFVTSRRRPDLS